MPQDERHGQRMKLDKIRVDDSDQIKLQRRYQRWTERLGQVDTVKRVLHGQIRAWTGLDAAKNAIAHVRTRRANALKRRTGEEISDMEVVLLEDWLDWSRPEEIRDGTDKKDPARIVTTDSSTYAILVNTPKKRKEIAGIEEMEFAEWYRVVEKGLKMEINKVQQELQIVNSDADDQEAMDVVDERMTNLDGRLRALQRRHTFLADYNYNWVPMEVRCQRLLHQHYEEVNQRVGEELQQATGTVYSSLPLSVRNGDLLGKLKAVTDKLLGTDYVARLDRYWAESRAVTLHPTLGTVSDWVDEVQVFLHGIDETIASLRDGPLEELQNVLDKVQLPARSLLDGTDPARVRLNRDHVLTELLRDQIKSLELPVVQMEAKQIQAMVWDVLQNKWIPPVVGRSDYASLRLTMDNLFVLWQTKSGKIIGCKAKTTKKGGGGGGGQQRASLAERKNGDGSFTSDKVCRHFQKKEGCRYGDKCRFSHETSGKRRRDGKGGGGAAGGVQKKQKQGTGGKTYADWLQICRSNSKRCLGLPAELAAEGYVRGACLNWINRRCKREGAACKFTHIRKAQLETYLRARQDGGGTSGANSKPAAALSLEDLDRRIATAIQRSKTTESKQTKLASARAYLSEAYHDEDLQKLSSAEQLHMASAMRKLNRK